MDSPFTLRAIFHDAWFATRGVKRKFWPAIIALILLNSLVIYGLEHLYHLPFQLLPYYVQFYLCPFLSGLVMAPLLTGLCCAAIARARHQAISLTTPFFGYRKIISIAITWFLLSVLSDLLWNILHWPFFAHLLSYPHTHWIITAYSVIISALLLFSLPLVLDKNYSPIAALGVSFQHNIRSFGKIIGTMLICYIILGIFSLIFSTLMIHARTTMALAGILFILILIWFVPFLLMLYGVLYRRIFDRAANTVTV